MKQLFRTTLPILSITVVLLFGLSAVAFAQEITGNIVGSVKDTNGAAVKGATVTIVDATTKQVTRTATTDDDGSFSARDLPVSSYTVTVESPNFKRHVETNVQVDVGHRKPVDVTLEVGSVAEVVTVESSPLTVELATPTVSTTITGDQARELSLNNRNWVQLITLAPGVSNDLADQVYVGTTNPAGQANTINISVNGARSAQNTYTVDGSDVTDRGSNITIQAYPSVDSIAEFKVLRSLFAAESGRSGGGQINVVTRSGGEQFHGSFYEFVRNERFNANDFISNRSTSPVFGRESNGDAKRAPFRYNDYGLTVGGPVYIPFFGEGGKAFGKAPRTYFFFSEEQRKDRRYPLLTAPAGVPDVNLRQGIFPIDICLSAFTAATSGAAPCTNVLAAGQPITSKIAVNPVAQQYVNFIYNKLPAPSDPVTRALVYPAQGIFDFRQEILRLDHGFSDKLSLYYRYENDKIPTIDPSSIFSSGANLPEVSKTETQSPGKTHTVQVTYVASPSTVVVGRYNYGFGAIVSKDIGTIALANSPITPPLAYAKTRDYVPTVAGNGYSTLTTFGDYNNFSNKNNFSGDLSWTRGRHSIKFGGVYSRYRKNENALAGNNAGGFSGFLNTTANSGVQTSTLAPNAAAQEPVAARRTSFQNWANFLIGNNVAFTQARFDYVADLRQVTVENYIQDEWRFRSNITVYYGVRYSYFGAPYDVNGRLSNFDPRLFNAANAPQVTGAGNRIVGTGNFCNGMIVNAQNLQTAANGCVPTASPYGNKVVQAPKGDFAPRIGLAWDPFKKGKTSIRVGYGMYYDQVLNGTYEQNIGTNPPYQETFSVSAISGGSAATTPRLDQPVPSGIPVAAGASLTPLSIRAIQPNWKDPYMQHWSAEWQQQFGTKSLVSIGYFGSKGTHLIGAFELNELPPGYAIARGATGCATGASTTPTVPCQVAGTYFGGTGGQSSNILDQIRPYRGYRSINMVTPQFNSNYNSLQTYAQRRFSGASQINVAYTWSKNLTDNQNDRSNAPENSYNIRLDRGRATLDRRHVFTANVIYELPFFKDQRDFAGHLLGGWQLSSIVTLQSGLPFTPTTNFDASGLGNVPAIIAGNRPNVLCDPNSNAPQTFEQWFNTTCFQQNPTSGVGFGNFVGNGGRGVIQGPPTKRVDFSVFKNVKFNEKVKLQLRGEAFNIFNHTNFRGITSTAIQNFGGTFGVISTVRDPRTISLGAKLSF
jgi:hypothetical protein